MNERIIPRPSSCFSIAAVALLSLSTFACAEHDEFGSESGDELELEEAMAEVDPQMDTEVDPNDNETEPDQFRNGFNGRRDVVYAMRPYDSHWGDFSPYAYCPDGTYATGFSQKIEGFRSGGDDTASNGIKLYCSGPGPSTQIVETNNSGQWGGWYSTGPSADPYEVCYMENVPGFSYFRGATIRGGAQGEDDFGIGTVRMHCGALGLEMSTAENTHLDALEQTQVTQYCPVYSALCGVRTRVESAQGGDDPFLPGLQNDDTSMNGIEFACCCEPPFVMGPSGACIREHELPASAVFAVTLQTTNGQYLTAEGGGDGEMIANRNTPSYWEQFYIFDLNGGTLQSGDSIALRTKTHGYYVVAEGGGGGVVNVNRRDRAEWETFTIVKTQGGGDIAYGDVVAFRAHNGQYVVAEGGGGGTVNANRNAIGEWEQFTLGPG